MSLSLDIKYRGITYILTVQNDSKGHGNLTEFSLIQCHLKLSRRKSILHCNMKRRKLVDVPQTEVKYTLYPHQRFGTDFMMDGGMELIFLYSDSDS